MRVLWVLIFGAVLVWSAINPHDRLTWILEVAPAIIGLVILAATRRKFPLTPLLYVLILIHAIVLMVGGHYTYAQEPFFEWLKTAAGFERNNFDKLGHFLQGFVPAIIAREVLIRHHVVAHAGWRNFLIVCVCLAFSAFYELIEWVAALLSEEAAESFLGTQGYVWDTQSDMAFALTGAIAALFLLGRLHDRQLSKLTAED